MHSMLLQTLNHIVKLDKNEEAIICERFKPISIARGDFFLQEHTISKHVGFLQKGLVRYFVHKNDHEATFEFTKEGEFVSDYQSFNQQTDSLQNIQAIEDCEMLVISHPDLHDIFNHTPHGDLLGRVILEHRFDVMVRQLMAIYMQSQEERYHHFMKYYSDLAQRIPQYMIASYVGIQPQSLSRIRRKAR